MSQSPRAACPHRKICRPSAGVATGGRRTSLRPPDGVTHTRDTCRGACKQGRRAAVILSADDYDSIMETLAILSDQELMREVRAAEAEAESGEIYSLDEVTEEMRAAGRLPR
ncbi:type II toxin-antitoxin system Phd/YefM family antitoxin [Mycobacterium kansasii]